MYHCMRKTGSGVWCILQPLTPKYSKGQLDKKNNTKVKLLTQIIKQPKNTLGGWVGAIRTGQITPPKAKWENPPPHSSKIKIKYQTQG